MLRYCPSFTQLEQWQTWKKGLAIATGLVVLALAILVIVILSNPGIFLKPLVEGIHIKELGMSLAELKELNNNPEGKKKMLRAVNALMAKRMVGQRVDVDADDIRLTSTFPDHQLSDSCGEKIRLSNIQCEAEGGMLRSSSLDADVQSMSHSVSAFLQANLDTEAKVALTFRFEKGKKVQLEKLTLQQASRGPIYNWTLTMEN